MNSNSTLNRNPIHIKRRLARAFTLVEMLVVIAITAILLGLLFGPVIQSFNLTRRARAVSQAQDAARTGIERLTRELGEATFVYDNSLAPVGIPLTPPNTDRGYGAPEYTTAPSPDAWVYISNARIDFALTSSRTNSTQLIDPTTGNPLSGVELQPGVRGKMVVRYFLALRNPSNADGTNQYYSNNYEFRAQSTSDRTFNPVILYRAEYDPSDPNLINQNPATFRGNAPGQGGFNDPQFFYTTTASDTTQKNSSGVAANGKSYSANWQAIATPVLQSENVDLLRWNRVGAAANNGTLGTGVGQNQIDPKDPFSPTVSFSPVSVPGDIAAPGSLTSGGVETGSAVPTLYSTKFGAWAYPYQITVLRGSTGYNPSVTRPIEPFGSMSIKVDLNYDATGNYVINADGLPELKVTVTDAFMNLPADATSNLYALYSPTTRKLFIKSPNLTFAIDPARGRIETAFPPLEGLATGAPMVTLYGTTTPSTLGVESSITPAGCTAPAPPHGDLIETQYVIDTRDPNAAPSGQSTMATNQGLLSADLFAAAYSLTNTPITTPGSLLSPLSVFGTSNGGSALRGVRIIPGTERIAAALTDGGAMTSWSRIPGSYPSQPDAKLSVDPTTNVGTFINVLPRVPNYGFDYDLFPATSAAVLQELLEFDAPGQPGAASLAAGLAANNAANVNFLTGTYLWQNNFSRDPQASDATWGWPLSASATAVAQGTSTLPEADIFRVDYATRSQFTISLGARVYDPESTSVQSIQVSDKVLVNNALR